MKTVVRNIGQIVSGDVGAPLADGDTIVCVDGRMERGEYRKFRIKGTRARRGDRVVPDDFAAMEEVVGRRYRGHARDRE